MINLSYLYEPLKLGAHFRSIVNDFVVDEILGFTPTGEGEHLLVRIVKTNANTQFVAQKLAGVCGVRDRDVSYSGMKDRFAVTSQWFSVHLPGKANPDLSCLLEYGIRIIEVHRHNKKLRRGAHAANAFQITLRECSGRKTDWENRLDMIAVGGFPNYFGEQRFGRNHQNLAAAKRLFSRLHGRKKRNHKEGIYISAARSWLFNRVLSRRVADGLYNEITVGDVLMLDGANSIFTVDCVDDTLQSRVREGNLHITGPLWGNGRSLTSASRHAWEVQSIAGDDLLRDGLETLRLRHERRALRAFAKKLRWKWANETTLCLKFVLAKGSFATGLLRELAVLYTRDQKSEFE